jgi:hypothetical protein
MYLVTGLVIGAILLLTLKGWRRIALVLALPIVLNGIFMANSRGAFLGLLAGGAVVFFLSPPQRRWVFWGFAALGVAASFVLVDEKFIERMTTIRSAAQASEEADSSALSRWVLLEAQLKMAARYPHGSGFRGTAALSREYLDEKWLWKGGDPEKSGRSSHNTFMTALVEHGVVGTAIYVWLTLWGVTAIARVKSLQRRRMDPALTAPAAACCAAFAVIWTAGQFTDYLHAEVQFWLFALLAASLEQLRQLEARSAPIQAGGEQSDRAFAAGRST